METLALDDTPNSPGNAPCVERTMPYIQVPGSPIPEIDKKKKYQTPNKRPKAKQIY